MSEQETYHAELTCRRCGHHGLFAEPLPAAEVWRYETSCQECHWVDRMGRRPQSERIKATGQEALL